MKRLKLSEHMLRGCKGTEQTAEYWLKIDKSKTCCCAAGSAFLSLKGKKFKRHGLGYMGEEIVRAFPDLEGPSIPDLPFHLEGNLLEQISELNRVMTREEIAEKLREAGY